MNEIVIRSETPTDFPAIRNLIVEVFTETYGSGEGEANLVEHLRKLPSPIDNISLVAELENALVGHIFFSPVVLTEHPDISACVLAPLGVNRQFQKQGIGSDLIKAGFVECDRLGHKIVIVQGSLDYYPRFGFVSISSTGLYTIFKSEHDMVLGLEPGLLDNLSGLVDYPPPWHDL